MNQEESEDSKKSTRGVLNRGPQPHGPKSIVLKTICVAILRNIKVQIDKPEFIFEIITEINVNKIDPLASDTDMFTLI